MNSWSRLGKSSCSDSLSSSEMDKIRVYLYSICFNFGKKSAKPACVALMIYNTRYLSS